MLHKKETFNKNMLYDKNDSQENMLYIIDFKKSFDKPKFQFSNFYALKDSGTSQWTLPHFKSNEKHYSNNSSQINMKQKGIFNKINIPVHHLNLCHEKKNSMHEKLLSYSLSKELKNKSVSPLRSIDITNKNKFTTLNPLESMHRMNNFFHQDEDDFFINKKIRRISVENIEFKGNIEKLICSNKKKLTRIARYSCKTKQGQLYDGSNKTNQDSFLLKYKIFNLNKFSLFGVFDGHGTHGHYVSNIVKTFFSDYYSQDELFFLQNNSNDCNLLTRLSSSLKLISFPKKGVYSLDLYPPDNKDERQLTKEEIILSKLKEKNYSLIKKSFSLADIALSKSRYDAKFSGTTGVLVFIIDDKVICANTGDSRAILIADTQLGASKIYQLSKDHKPNVKDERNRILKCNGRVERKSFGGERIGPFRVWHKNENYPGLGMSRSLGDFVLKSVGVICDPDLTEISLRNIKAKVIVIASDGVWEYLQNEEIKSIVLPFYMFLDADGAAGRIIQEAHKCWKKKGNAVDDITVIVLFLEDY